MKGHRQSFFSEVEVMVSVTTLFTVWADLVGDTRTLYVGWSWQSRETGCACLNDGWMVCGRLDSLSAVGSHCGLWSRQS